MRGRGHLYSTATVMTLDRTSHLRLFDYPASCSIGINTDNPANMSKEQNEIVDESKETFTSFLKKLKACHQERLNPKSNEGRLVKFEDRLDKSELTREDIFKQATGKYLMQWRGVAVIKGSLDYCIYQLMLQEIKPATIIETGTFNGGSALWFADFMKIHDTKTHVYSMDIDHSYLDPGIKKRDDITFIQGDSFKIEEAFPEEMLKSLPHPWLVTEDTHVNLPGILAYFDKFIEPGDYLVVEDTHPELNTRLGYGLLKEIEYAPVGPTWTLDPYKEFMKKHGSKYRVDTAYTDLYGYNATFNYNSILRRI